MRNSCMSIFLRGRTALLLLQLAGVTLAFPFPVAHPEPYPELGESLGRQGLLAGARHGHGASHRGNRAAGFIPGEAIYVDETGQRERAEFGTGKSMADVMMEYPNNFEHQVKPGCGLEFAGFGGPEVQHRAASEEVLEDDTPMPGDAPASVDPGKEPEPLGPGERLVPDDGPNDHDDTEIIPLAPGSGHSSRRGSGHRHRHHGYA